MENLQKWALGFLLNHYDSTYEDLLENLVIQIWIYGDREHCTYKFVKLWIN